MFLRHLLNRPIIPLLNYQRRAGNFQPIIFTNNIVNPRDLKPRTASSNSTMTDPRTPVLTNNAPNPLPGLYSQAVVANGLVFCSGNVAMDPQTNKIIDGDVQAHTVRAPRGKYVHFANQDLASMHQEHFCDSRRCWLKYQARCKGERVSCRYGRFREDERGLYDLLGRCEALSDVSRAAPLYVRTCWHLV